MSNLHLSAAQRRQLEQQLRGATDAGLFRRTLAVLEAAAGRPIAEIARLLRASRVSVYHWIDCYEQDRDPTDLADDRGGNHPTVWTEDLQAALVASLQRRPTDFGYQALQWTVCLLQEHLENWYGERVSATSIRQQLRALDYVWKRPRYVLAPDPERDKKNAASAGKSRPCRRAGSSCSRTRPTCCCSRRCGRRGDGAASLWRCRSRGAMPDASSLGRLASRPGTACSWRGNGSGRGTSRHSCRW